MNLTEKTRAANHWLDEMLLALAPLLMKVGFVSGTTDLLLSGVLETNPFFQLGWALTQAISVDSIFFVVAFCFWNTKSRGDRWAFGALLLLYGLVAFIVTDVQAFQQLQSATAVISMQRLSISPAVFTNARSALVIVTAALFYLVERKVKQVEHDVEQGGTEEPINETVVTTLEPPETVSVSIPEHAVSLGTQDVPLMEQVLQLMKQEPGIGPAEVGRRLSIPKSTAFRKMREASESETVRKAGGVAQGQV